MVTLTITVGIPGSGKSAEIERRTTGPYARLPIVVSPDQIRHDVYGNRSDQTHNPDVFRIAHGLTEAALNGGWDVIFDATNLRPEHRVVLAEIADRAGVRRRALRFSSVDAAVTRNAVRDVHRVPSKAMAAMTRDFNAHAGIWQLWSEGWAVLDVDTSTPGVVSYTPYMPAAQ